MDFGHPLIFFKFQYVVGDVKRNTFYHWPKVPTIQGQIENRLQSWKKLLAVSRFIFLISETKRDTKTDPKQKVVY